MKIRRVALRNFRLHAESDVWLQLSGVSGIVGSNETGKSTILEGALWALFGAAATRGKKGSLRWHGAPARRTAAVVLDFEVAGGRYSIERSESGAKLTDLRTGNVLAEGTDPVTSYVPTLLGMGFDEFRASFLCEQKDLARMGAMKPTERQTFVRQVLGISRIDDGLASCRKATNALATRVSGIVTGLGERKPIEDLIETERLNVAAAEIRTENHRKDAHRTVSTLADVEAELAASTDAKTEHDALIAASMAAQERLKTAVTEIEGLEKAQASQRAAAAKLAAEEPKLEPLPALREERDELVAARAAVSERETLTTRLQQLSEEEGEANSAIAAARSQMDAYDSDALIAANEHAKAADANYDRMRSGREGHRQRQLAAAERFDADAKKHRRRLEAIQKAGEDGDCPTCVRRLGAQFAQVEEHLKDDIRQAENAAEDCRVAAAELEDPTDDEINLGIARNHAEQEVERLLELKRAADDAFRRHVDAQKALTKATNDRVAVEAKLAALPTADFDAERLAVIESEIQQLQNLDRSLVSYRSLVAQAAETEKTLARWTRARDDARETVQGCAKDIELLAFDAAEHDEIVQRHAVIKAETETARVALARAEEGLISHEAALARAEQDLVEYDRRAALLEEERRSLRIHEKAVTGLDAFRVAKAGSIRPELEELMSGFVHLLTDGRHEAVTLTEDFTPVLSEGGAAMEVVSGGTEDIVALAMRLAMSQMITERAGHPLELLWLDEPFGSLDVVRRANVLALLDQLRRVFSQIILTSHVEETRDAVDHVIELAHDEAAGCTRVVSAPTTATEAA